MEGHGILTTPAPRDGTTIGRGPEPCGETNGNAGAPTATLAAGQETTVEYDLRAAHNGPCRVNVADDPELSQISSRLTQTLAIHSNITGNEAEAKAALSHLDRTTGQFNDLNYSFAPYAHIGQPQSEHLIRCNLLASLWMSPLSSYYRSSDVKSAGLECTQWYVDNDPPSTNWFMNQIWVPINVGQLLFIYGDQMAEPLSCWQRPS